MLRLQAPEASVRRALGSLGLEGTQLVVCEKDVVLSIPGARATVGAALAQQGLTVTETHEFPAAAP